MFYQQAFKRVATYSPDEAAHEGWLDEYNELCAFVLLCEEEYSQGLISELDAYDLWGA